MLYCTYEQYQTAGGALDEAAFDTLCARASRLIDRHTFGRAEPHARACAGCAALLADACVQIIDDVLLRIFPFNQTFLVVFQLHGRSPSIIIRDVLYRVSAYLIRINRHRSFDSCYRRHENQSLSLIHISEPTRH